MELQSKQLVQLNHETDHSILQKLMFYFFQFLGAVVHEIFIKLQVMNIICGKMSQVPSPSTKCQFTLDPSFRYFFEFKIRFFCSDFREMDSPSESTLSENTQITNFLTS